MRKTADNLQIPEAQFEDIDDDGRNIGASVENSIQDGNSSALNGHPVEKTILSP